MSTRRKIFWTIILAFAFFALMQTADPQTPRREPDTTAKDLKEWYEQYNELYFQKRLPTDTTFDLNLHDGNMAETTMPGWVMYNISMDKHYVAAKRVGRLTLIHEMCHIDTWTESLDEKVQHGAKWNACMLRIDMAEGFRYIIIDHYGDQQ